MLLEKCYTDFKYGIPCNVFYIHNMKGEPLL